MGLFVKLRLTSSCSLSVKQRLMKCCESDHKLPTWVNWKHHTEYYHSIFLRCQLYRGPSSSHSPEYLSDRFSTVCNSLKPVRGSAMNPLAAPASESFTTLMFKRRFTIQILSMDAPIAKFCHAASRELSSLQLTKISFRPTEYISFVPSR